MHDVTLRRQISHLVQDASGIFLRSPKIASQSRCPCRCRICGAPTNSARHRWPRLISARFHPPLNTSPSTSIPTSSEQCERKVFYAELIQQQQDFFLHARPQTPLAHTHLQPRRSTTHDPAHLLVQKIDAIADSPRLSLGVRTTMLWNGDGSLGRAEPGNQVAPVVGSVLPAAIGCGAGARAGAGTRR